MNLQSIVILLQLVLVLLSNPQTAQNQQVQILTNQAIGYSTQALQQMAIVPVASTTFLPPNPTVIPQDEPTGLGSPDLSSIVQPVSIIIPNSCSLIARPDLSSDRAGIYTWASSRIPTSTTGQLYFGQMIGMGSTSVFQWTPFGQNESPITSSQGSVETHYVNSGGPWNWDGENQFMLTLGDASCTYTYVP